jgi:nitrous oxidase accessory protein
MSHHLLAILLLTLLASPAAAQGDSFDLPAALAAAQPGDTIVVPPGVYAGPLVVDVPGLTLEGQEGAVIDGGGLGDVFTVTAPDVTLRGLTIRNSGDSLDREHAGITGLAPRLTIENNRLENVLFGIYLKEAPDSVMRGNRYRHGPAHRPPRRRHPHLAEPWHAGGGQLCLRRARCGDVVLQRRVLRRNVVENGRYGLHFMFSDNQTLEENVLRNNSVGAYLMYGRGLTCSNNLLLDNNGPSGYGVALKDVDDVLAVGNRMVNNRVGIYVDNSPREADTTVLFEDNLLAYNEIGVEMLPLVRRNTFTNNIFQENREQIAIAGGGELRGNDWSHDGWGNYWSDYAGFDADGDQCRRHGLPLHQPVRESDGAVPGAAPLPAQPGHRRAGPGRARLPGLPAARQDGRRAPTDGAAPLARRARPARTATLANLAVALGCWGWPVWCCLLA